ncbi:MAG TPA: histidinol-phosphate transaminase [Bdellovibrionales bacterium]|nr:histidinol-phosphate transaminase [Bdellovibrionales bacterium]
MKVAPEILHLNPYVPGLPIDEVKRRFGVKEVYKLASNENALGPGPKTKQAIADALSETHRYPDGACYDLKNALAGYYGVTPDNLALGNGSDDLFNLLIRAFCEPGDQILTAQYAFVAYKIAAQASRVETVEVPVGPDFNYRLSDLARAWTPRMKLIFIANPNNPTGRYHSKKEVDELLSQLGNRDDVLIIFDEAYHEFVRAADYESALARVPAYKNVLVLRTFSKVFGLAGLRLGALIGQPEIVSIVNRVRQPFNVNSVVQAAAITALGEAEHIVESQKLVWTGLDYLYGELTRLGLEYWPSQGNFVLLDTRRDAKAVDQALLRRGIILRPLLNYGLVRHLRMSVGRPEENRAAIEALAQVLGEVSPLAGLEGRA